MSQDQSSAPQRLQPRDQSPPSPASPTGGPPRYTSEDLLRGHDEVIITHADKLYRLRRTRQDKLILTT